MPSTEPFASLHLFPGFSGGPCPPESATPWSENLPEFSLAEVIEVLWLGYEINASASFNLQTTYQPTDGNPVTYTATYSASDSGVTVFSPLAPAARVCGVVSGNPPDETIEFADGTGETTYQEIGGESGSLGSYTFVHQCRLWFQRHGGAFGTLVRRNTTNNRYQFLFGLTHDIGSPIKLHLGDSATWVAGGGDPGRVIGASTVSIFGYTVPVWFEWTGGIGIGRSYSAFSHSLTFTLGEQFTIA